MALAPIRLPRLPKTTQFTDPQTGYPTQQGQLWWQRAMEQIEAGVNGVIAAQAAAETAQTAAATAQTAADTAQAAADAAQAAVDNIEVPPSGTRTVTASDNILDTDSTILADASGGAIVLSLPAATSISHPFTVQKIDASANTVTIDATGADSINGGPNIALATQYEDVSLNSDGANDWYAF